MESDESVRKLQRELNAGTVSLVLLALLERARQPIYGYQLAKQLETTDGREPLIKAGTLYPVLRALEAQGLLESLVEPSVSGPPRRYYAISNKGRESLQAWTDAWTRTRDFVDEVLAGRLAVTDQGETR